MIRDIQREELILSSLKLSIILSALDAIAIGPIPLTWIAAWIPIFASLMLKGSYKSVPIYLYALMLWAVFAQGLSLLCLAYDSCMDFRMPSLSTTPYPVYIVLRFIPFLMLASIISILAPVKYRIGEIYDYIVNAGAWIALFALYVYLAQRFGLPDIPRSRLGTDGLEVTTVSFSYAFHRALGTFREPSGMAAWLMLPFFLSLLSRNWRAFIIGGAILLSGSMSAFVAIISGLLLSLFYVGLKNSGGGTLFVKVPIRIGMVISLSFLMFVIFVDNRQSDQGLLDVIQDRLIPVVDGGIEESNRGYVFDFAADIGIPFIGLGLGNSNLMLTAWLGGHAVSGMLSLYLNILMSLGVVGFFMLILFLLSPLFRRVQDIHPSLIFSCYGGYFSWLTIFTIHSAEFPVMFAMTYGLVSYLEFIHPSVTVA